MKISVSLFVFFTVLCLESVGQPPDSVKYKSLKPHDFNLAFQKDSNAYLIDVREYFECKKSRIKGSINIPSSGNIDTASDTINKDIPLYIYCTSGYRAKKVCARLSEKGFTKLYNLEGGINAWKEEGLPVDKKRRKGAGAQRIKRGEGVTG
jgi:rhodanese-related sulfurtransferase